MTRIPAPDPKWLPFLKVGFGFALVLVTGALAAIIAMGKVEEHTSYGLPYILGALATLCGGFSQWAFGSGGKDREKDEEQNAADQS